MRRHSGDKSFTTLENRTQVECSMKPTGFWYDFNNEWTEWCESEMPHWLNNKIRYEVEIDTKDILILENKQDLTEFTNMYGYSISNLLTMQHINWIKVAETYKGIEIPNYLYNCRLDHNFFWYYGWDVASGCIWDTSTIKSLTIIDNLIEVDNVQKL